MSRSSDAGRAGGVDLPLGVRPLIGAPMAGGPTTPELVAAVSDAGALGMLDGAARRPDDLRAQLRRVRDLTSRPFGVNLFVPPTQDRARDEPALARYAQQLSPVAARFGVQLPLPSFEQADEWPGRIEALVTEPVALVSFTFGCPSPELVAALHRVDTCVAVTVTTLEEARSASERGADALVVQGVEAGGHRGVHSVHAQPNETSTIDLLAELSGVGLAMVAAGGVRGPGDVTRLLDAGAVAVQVGTLLLRADEAGTNATWRAELRAGVRETAGTRAYSGRVARGLQTTFMRDHGPEAPPVYPQVDQLTRPLRSAAAAAGDAEHLSMWAGTGYRAGRDAPASEIIDWLCPLA